jgi:hypothetical protein
MDDTDLRICEKRRYESEEEAQEQIEYIQSQDPDTEPLRIYKCHTCHNWHLTSKPPR